MRDVGRTVNDIAGLRVDDLVPDGEAGAALLDGEDLVVGMDVQRGTLADGVGDVADEGDAQLKAGAPSPVFRTVLPSKRPRRASPGFCQSAAGIFLSSAWERGGMGRLLSC